MSEIDSEDINQEEFQSEEPKGKFSKLLKEGDNKYRLPGMFKNWFLDYASYVILDRAVPHIEDGLKPVQRRILHAMRKIHDGSLIKVATIVGEEGNYRHVFADAVYTSLINCKIGKGIVEVAGNNLRWNIFFIKRDCKVQLLFKARIFLSDICIGALHFLVVFKLDYKVVVILLKLTKLTNGIKGILKTTGYKVNALIKRRND